MAVISQTRAATIESAFPGQSGPLTRRISVVQAAARPARPKQAANRFGFRKSGLRWVPAGCRAAPSAEPSGGGLSNFMEWPSPLHIGHGRRAADNSGSGYTYGRAPDGRSRPWITL